ncbi:VOC family protein [Halocatena halophila]|uniref:VOC family protein n=1 Tax=Halocatena halophila TaxID=2814576 RepID=UPI002ED482CE
MTDSDPLPTAEFVHHTALTVPDIDEAVDFFVEVLGCEELYRKGPFGDPDGDSMERRLGVHPDAVAELAMVRCGPTMNLELFEWDAPDQDETPLTLADTGATHLGIQVGSIDRALAALSDRDDVEVLDEPQTNDDGPTAGLTYVFCRTDWGLMLELLETPESMPYEQATDGRLFDPATPWNQAE